MNPYISVIIPAFNEEINLPDCLKAFQKQSYPKEKFEVIVVDNDSADRTSEVAVQQGARAVVYKAKHTIGAVRNFGASHAKGEVFAFMDADSYPETDWLQKIEDEFKKNQSIVAVCGIGLPINKALYLTILYDIYNILLQAYGLIGYIFPWGFNIAIKKEAYIKIEGFDETLRAFDDADVGLRIQRAYGRRKIIYTDKLRVYTSTRKQEDVKNFVSYMWDASLNHFSVLFLRRARNSKLKNVR